jgi:hypothetical protein
MDTHNPKIFHHPFDIICVAVLVFMILCPFVAFIGILIGQEPFIFTFAGFITASTLILALMRWINGRRSKLPPDPP